MKKIISLLLSLIIIFSITAGIDFSSYAITSYDFGYTLLDDGTAKITYYYGFEADLTIPSEIDGYYVTSIEESAFSECNCLENIYIPDSVIEIGAGNFYGCSNLKDIDVDKSNKNYTSQDGVLFNKDKTLLIKYPSGKANDTYAIPNCVTDIECDTFSGCDNLKNITISNSMTAINMHAFQYCTGLTNIVIPKNINAIEPYAFSYCSKLTDITIMGSVKSIGNHAFTHCSELKNITIMNGVETIEHNAFEYCTGLTEITIPESLTRIRDYAFSNCTNLRTVNYLSTSDSVYFGENPFYRTNVIKKHYDIIYKSNGGTPIPSQYKYEQETLKLSTAVPTKEGYRFLGWSTTSNGNVKYKPGDTYNINKDTTLYAVWKELEKYSIEYYINDTLYESQTKYENTSVTISNSIPEKRGYKFKYWSTSLCGNEIYNPGEVYSKNSNLKLYAVWALICEECNGNGYNQIEEKCNVCSGSGKTNEVITCPTCDGKRVEDVLWSRTCDECNGTGKYASQTCIYCKGNGRIYIQGRVCRTCSGSGKVNAINGCYKCNSTGIAKIKLSCANCKGTGIIDLGNNHTYNNGNITKESTCISNGEITYTCVNCGNIKIDTIPKLVHTPEIDEETEPTCTTSGLSEGSHCSVCNQIITKQEKIPEKGHSYQQIIIQPTCTDGGYTIYECAICGYSYKDNYSNALGHKFDNGKTTKQTTCTANGVKLYTCSQCKTTKTETVKALGHKYTTKIVKATYTSEGYTIHTCTKCKKSYKDKKTKKLVLKNTSLSKVTAGKKAFTAKWKKVSAAAGYQIQYSTDKNFKKNKKTVTVSKNSATSKTISKLKSKKKYYVRIRTYKTVKVNGKNTKIYSSWSKTKTVKTK